MLIKYTAIKSSAIVRLKTLYDSNHLKHPIKKARERKPRENQKSAIACMETKRALALRIEARTFLISEDRI